MVGISKEQMRDAPRLMSGDIIQCKACGNNHTVQASWNQTKGDWSDVILIIKCPQEEHTRLVGIHGKDVRQYFDPWNEETGEDAELMSQIEYVEEDGRRCPFCREVDTVESGRMNPKDGYATQEIRCHECGKEWTDIYTMTGYEVDGKQPE